jgi:hypothetical protein
VNLEIENNGLTRDATAADIHVGLAKLSSMGPRFAVLDRGPHRYIQAYALDSGDLDVEYRDGGPDRAYESPFPQPRDAVVDAFLSYLNDDNRWRTAFEWRRAEPEQ